MGEEQAPLRFTLRIPPTAKQRAQNTRKLLRLAKKQEFERNLAEKRNREAKEEAYRSRCRAVAENTVSRDDYYGGKA